MRVVVEGMSQVDVLMAGAHYAAARYLPDRFPADLGEVGLPAGGVILASGSGKPICGIHIPASTLFGIIFSKECLMIFHM